VLEHIVQIVLSAIAIVVFAVERFNTPPADPRAGIVPYRISRSTTTAASYYTAVSLYGAIAVAVFAFLLLSPKGLDLLAQMGPGVFSTIPTWARQSPELLVALILTVLLPKIPILSDMDEWFRTRLQRMAAIPHEVRRLSAQIRRAPFLVDSDGRQIVLNALVAHGFDPADVRFEEGSTPHDQWTKLSLLMHELDDWDADARFTSYVLTYPNEFNALKRRYDALLFRARKCFSLLRELATDPDPAKKGGAVYAYRDDFIQEVDGLLKAVYEAISNAVLLCELTERARINQLIKLGFGLDPKLPRRLTLNELLGLFTGLTVVGVLWVTLMGRSDSAGGMLKPREFVLAVMIAAIYCIGVWCAIYPKTRWSLARRRPESGRPWGWYLLSGAMATAAGAPISYLYQAGTHHWQWTEAWVGYWQVSPWGVMTFVVAYSLALLADDEPRDGFMGLLTATRLRWVETVGLMGVMAVTASVVVKLLRGAQSGIPDDQLLPVRPLWQIEIISVVIGFAMGVLVPSWYRTAPHETPVRRPQVASAD
jgi:hypothetical protein